MQVLGGLFVVGPSQDLLQDLVLLPGQAGHECRFVQRQDRLPF